MHLRYAKTLITGRPGVGKTTLVRSIMAQLGSTSMDGFITAEVREGGVRVGFELQGFDGTSRLLAHVDFPSRHRVARYGVDTIGFDTFLKKIDLMGSDADLIVIDEIGKMELFLRRFRNLVWELLDSEKTVLATIARQGGGMIKEIKSRSNLALFEVTRENRNQLIAEILR